MSRLDRRKNAPASTGVSGSSAAGAASTSSMQRRGLRLLSYNIQAGMGAARLRHYFTQSWKYLLPHAGRWHTLTQIAQSLREFDVIGLQETDAGSLRTGFTNQTEYLARLAAFPWWSDQVNRRVGRIAHHSNGLLSRLWPQEVIDHKLPGRQGRGVLQARFGEGIQCLEIFVVHLALSRRARRRQLAFLGDLVGEACHCVVMGDLNCDVSSREVRELLRSTQLRVPYQSRHTFPSWRPRRAIDHILVGSTIDVRWAEVYPWSFSDHLPMAMEIELPDAVSLPGPDEAASRYPGDGASAL